MTKKEKTNKLVNFAMRPSVFDKFSEICDRNFKTISEGLRELVVQKIREEEKENN
jgi:hypothetical protein